MNCCGDISGKVSTVFNSIKGNYSDWDILKIKWRRRAPGGEGYYCLSYL
jgi:hypothetical protein